MTFIKSKKKIIKKANWTIDNIDIKKWKESKNVIINKENISDIGIVKL